MSSFSKTIEATTNQLLKHFSDSDADRPDSILSDYPNTTSIQYGLELLLDVVFPGRNSKHTIHQVGLKAYLESELGQAIGVMLPEIEKAIPLCWLGEASLEKNSPEDIDAAALAEEVMNEFVAKLPQVREYLIQDIKAAYDGDPAAHSYAEVKMAYPGVLAIASHRLAHELYKLDVPAIPRVMSEWTHTQTGCDIHPGATIGHGFFVDHPTGVVIGETAVIGDGVKLYQGVTIGAKSFPLDEHGKPIKHIRRHPTLEDGVIVYSNATILGGDTVIGKGTTVGGNVFLLESVPPASFVTNSSTQPKIKPQK